MSIIYREAGIADIDQIMRVRMAVRENRLSRADLVTDKDCEDYITRRGKGWVCEAAGTIVGFAIADLEDHNIWALFLEPEWEGRGIGKKLQQLMLDWYFAQTKATVWLTTAPASRAEGFYRNSGWTETGRKPNGEIRFEMTYADWQNRSSA